MTAPPTTFVRHATADDLDELVSLARRSFFDAYSETDDHAIIDAYCVRNFTRERFASILADPRSKVLVADHGQGCFAGYAQVASSSPPPSVRCAQPIELVRLYLAREWTGRGVGTVLMRAAIDEARRLGGSTLWLGVYERNPRAIAFYERFGMRVVGTKPWEWGGEILQDPVMERAI